MDDPRRLKRRRPVTWALGIALGYLAIAGAWILFSDRAVAWLTDDPQFREWLQTGKGFVFVLVTALLLFGFTRWMGRSLLRANRLAEWSQRDALTGLASRFQLVTVLDKLLESGERQVDRLAVIALDVARLRRINASFGVQATDGLLFQLAHALGGLREPRLVLSRPGSDHFVAVLKGPCDAQEARLMAQRLIQAGAGPFQVEGRPIRLRLDAGVAMAPADGQDAQMLLQRAQTAVFDAKRQEKGSVSFAGTIGEQEDIKTIRLESDLGQALEKEQFQLYYQPLFCLRSGRMVGCEALLRWMHPDYGVVAPDRFIPLLEQGGEIVEVGDWVIRESARQIKEWQQHEPELSVAINLSRRQLWDPALPERLEEALASHGLAPQSLCMEVTETLAMQDPTLTREVLKSLRERGIQLAMDDFGSGYSCLAYLKHYPLDTLKIDRAFVSGVPDDGDNLNLLRIILHMANAFHLTTVAEGVETEAEARTLRSLGCDKAQGYWMAKPMPVDAMTRFLAEGQADNPLAALANGIRPGAQSGAR